MDDLFSSSTTSSDPQVIYSSTLFQSRLVYVYRLPPRSSTTSGYKANDWADPKTGDLASTAIWKGRLRVVEMERKGICEIRLEDGETGELFALCPYTPTTSHEAVEPVTDSSRYFVLRVESPNPNGGPPRRAYIGMGFEDRDMSFDFNVALSSWVKRQKNAAAGGGGRGEAGEAGADEGPSPHLPKEGAKDLSLKQGQTFAVKIPGAGGRKIREGGASLLGGGGGGGGGGGPLLPPPPSRKR
ncbi:adaptin ear-binding coat-associated protein 1 NECAP-1 [Jaminaea rosea]|uniref:Adaptin ear-binding coat-associated protein 1 NECAP-1 n=1 Tax=Jaminaea rosea TaxID=1569628 RepID=A0A316UHP1_9BASI|nr:adaptin ear-binding coat-associated protein 1 NECAP-1 [Jaminaea rosea]PWN24730.1 adaptin ear-binding coat-associated protein 1 NECAP-1 [Jaminaea rosea]